MKRNRAAIILFIMLLPATLAAQAVYDYSGIYAAANPAIVNITTDDGAGSGFLVTAYGHIATNYHVIYNSRYLAVQFSDGRKVQASLVAANPHFDMALLKVNSSVVDGIRPLPIISLEKEITIEVGIPVVAIGSPMNKKFMMTQGILSKLDEEAILGDFLLQPGSSGGPLLNREGEVIGINTFGEGSIGGAIRIGTLREYLESSELSQSLDVEPPERLLPSLDPKRYPVSILNYKIEHEPLDLNAYKLEAGDFEITAITPVLIGKVGVMQQRMRASNRFERRSKEISDPSYHGVSETFFEWHSSTEAALDYGVTFDIRPRFGLTTRSKLSRAFSVFLMLGMTGKLDMEFKGEFSDFRIYRDGQLLEPVLPGRAVIEGSTENRNRFIDEAYSGNYVYRPEEFLTGEEFRIEVIDARLPDQIHKQIILKADSPLIKQLRADFTYAAEFFMGMAPQH